MATMRAVDIRNGAGPASSLFISDSVLKPTCKASECLVSVRYFGLNRADTLQREGKYPVPTGVTNIMGLEFSGTVEEVGGDGQGDWKQGDEVFGLAYGGAYAEFVTVNKRMLIHKPQELSLEVCGGLCEVWFTALQALYLVGGYAPKTTKSVLFHAGASSVSIAGIQLVLADAEPFTSVFVTARQDAKVKFCTEQLGAKGGINTTTVKNGDWAGAIRELNDNKGIDLVIDYIGAPYFQQNLDVLALDGRVVQLGVMGGIDLSGQGKDGKGVDISAFVRKRVRFEGSTLRSRDPEYQGKLRDLFVEKVLPGLLGQAQGKGFQNHVDRVVSWREITRAHEALEGNKTMGKIVCRVD